jgi:AraC-like DNA-binding protein
MELEPRYVIKFFAEEGMQAVQILSRLRDHYGTEAFSRAQVSSWINEVKRGRTDLNTVASPGREPDEGLAAVIAGKLDADPHLSARKLAHSLGIAASTFCRDLTEVLGMKCRHLRWVPHMVMQLQKDARLESAQAMLREFAKH